MARTRQPIVAIAVAAATSLLLWYPSAGAGILLTLAAGGSSFLRPGFVAAPALISLGLLVVPIGAMVAAARGVPDRGTILLVGFLVVVWQFGWVGIVLVTGNGTLLAWPSYVPPVEPEPDWEPVRVFALGFAAVGLLSGVVAFLAALSVQRTRPLAP